MVAWPGLSSQAPARLAQRRDESAAGCPVFVRGMSIEKVNVSCEPFQGIFKAINPAGSEAGKLRKGITTGALALSM